MNRFVSLLFALALAACTPPAPPEPAKLTVAAASNLTGVLDEIAAASHKETGIRIVLSYGSTAQLSQQIGNGAPFDVFAAADTEHVDQLVSKGLVVANSRAIYARGQLALWVPNGEKLGVREFKDLARPEVRFVAVAQPALAPYGKAAVEAMKSAGLWVALQPKIVYANNINMAKQYAGTGNADAAFTAYSLVFRETGAVLTIDPKLYPPIDQALGVVASSKQRERARQFTAFLLGAEGRAKLLRGGYLVP
ncbi:MAG TPA: molybdate ABC transporter substrate-binding protein [Bryobacteraceae bacterium]|nr:molybdate ABC transporter substrate-binding protein [Bryobacteraceae bacterium]